MFLDYFFYLLFKSRLINLKKSETGFTLLEVLIVSIIIGIMSAIALPGYMQWVDNTKYAHAKSQMNCTAKELHIFKLEKGYFPADTWPYFRPQGVECFYIPNTGQIPFDSLYDYENWTAPGGKCYLQITFYGKDKTRQTGTSYSAVYATPGFYEKINGGDDMVLSLGIQDCN